VWAASFKSLYQKRPVWEYAVAQGCVVGRSRYSTKTYENISAPPDRETSTHAVAGFANEAVVFSL
jgi:hypothetical protein